MVNFHWFLDLSMECSLLFNPKLNIFDNFVLLKQIELLPEILLDILTLISYIRNHDITQ